MFREHSGRTNDMDTIKYATFRYDTVEVENWLYTGQRSAERRAFSPSIPVSSHKECWQSSFSRQREQKPF